MKSSSKGHGKARSKVGQEVEEKQGEEKFPGEERESGVHATEPVSEEPASKEPVLDQEQEVPVEEQDHDAVPEPVTCDVCGFEGHTSDECPSLADADAQQQAFIDRQREAAFERDEERALAEEAERAAMEKYEAEQDDKISRFKRIRTAANRESKAPSSGREFDVGDQTELGARMLKELEEKGPVIYDDGRLYQYEPKDGVWRPVSQDTQSRIVQEFSGTIISGSKSKVVRVNHADIRGAIHIASSRVSKPGFFLNMPAVHGCAFANGYVVVDKKGIHLKKHDPSNRARWGYDFPFVENPLPARMLRFLDDVFRDDKDKEQKIALVQEFCGIAILGQGTRLSHCLVLTSFLDMGQGGNKNGQNGKSQLARIIESLMPPGSVVSIRPQDFESEYRRARLAGKLLNSVSEMPEGDILDSASFKAIVTGDQIEGRHIREAPFDFTPHAAHVYACNNPPGTSDLTHAFFRRFIFLLFNRFFSPADPNFVLDIGKVIAEAERELLPSWALVGAARAIAKRDYTKVPSSDVAIEAWRKGVDQVALFVAEKTGKSKDPAPGRSAHDWTAAATVYRAYAQWARDTGHAALASNKFGLRMGLLGLGWHKTTKGHFYPVQVLR